MKTFSPTFSQNKFSGMSFSSMKKNYSITPIFGLLAIAMGFVAVAITHTLRNPEVSVRRGTNPEPWQEYEQKQYKYLASGRDYSIPSPAPKY